MQVLWSLPPEPPPALTVVLTCVFLMAYWCLFIGFLPSISSMRSVSSSPLPIFLVGLFYFRGGYAIVRILYMFWILIFKLSVSQIFSCSLAVFFSPLCIVFFFFLTHTQIKFILPSSPFSFLRHSLSILPRGASNPGSSHCYSFLNARITKHTIELSF